MIERQDKFNDFSTWIDVIYFFTVTSLTIGYGDITPTTPTSKLFSVVYIFIAVATVGNLVGGVASWVIQKKRARFLQLLRSRELTLKDLATMDNDGDGKVSMLDYIEFMLVAMDKVDRELLDALRCQFQKLDELGTGELSKDVLKEQFVKKLKTARWKLALAEYKKKIVKAGKVKRLRKFFETP